MFFSNAYFYRFTKEVPGLDPKSLEEKLQPLAAKPCLPHEAVKKGWGPALGSVGTSLVHSQDGNILIRLVKEEKILPSSVLARAAKERIADEEQRIGDTISKGRKQKIKEECAEELIARAFSRFSETKILIMPKLELVVVDASSAKKAEEATHLLRISVGSLPIVPVQTQNSPDFCMTEWLRGKDVPAGFNLGYNALLESDAKSAINCKNLDVNRDDIIHLVESEFIITKLALSWQDKASFTLSDDLSLKKIKFSDELLFERDVEDESDVAAVMDADLFLMISQFKELIPLIFESFGGLVPLQQ